MGDEPDPDEVERQRLAKEAAEKAAAQARDPVWSTVKAIRDKDVRAALLKRLEAVPAPDGASMQAAQPPGDAREDVLNTAHAVLASERKSRFWWRFLVGLTIVLVAVILWIALVGHGIGEFSSNRLIILLAMIFVTVGMGGFLVARALLSENADGDLEKRFQMAREIFLVFSGIFATVVGFYFGSSQHDESSASVEISAQLSEKSIVATVKSASRVKGLAIVTASQSLPLIAATDQPDRFTLAAIAGPCPAGGSFVATFADGATADAQPVAFSKDELAAAGWTGCADAGPGDGQGGAASDAASGAAEGN